jgi:hypothetical protein
MNQSIGFLSDAQRLVQGSLIDGAERRLPDRRVLSGRDLSLRGFPGRFPKRFFCPFYPRTGVRRGDGGFF